MIFPEDIRKAKAATLDPIVEKAVDSLLAKNWNGASATIPQDDLIALITSGGKYSRQQLFDLNLLEFAEAYRVNGWKVFYDRPGYNESYEPSWKFTK